MESCLVLSQKDLLGVGGKVLWPPHKMRRVKSQHWRPPQRASSLPPVTSAWPPIHNMPGSWPLLRVSPHVSSHAENVSPHPHKRMLQPSCVGCHTFRKFRKINLLFKEKEMWSEHFWRISKTTACSVWISQRPAQLISPSVKKFISPDKRMESLSLHKENFWFSIQLAETRS